MDALIAVSGHFLNTFDMVATPEVKQQLINTMGVVHDNVALVCVDYFQRCVSYSIWQPMFIVILTSYMSIYYNAALAVVV